MLDLDRLDIEMLYLLLLENKTSPIQAFRIRDIIDQTELKSTYYTFVRRMQNKLIPAKLTSEGYKIRNAKTYYITKEGIDYLNKKLSTEKEERLYEMEE